MSFPHGTPGREPRIGTAPPAPAPEARGRQPHTDAVACTWKQAFRYACTPFVSCALADRHRPSPIRVQDPPPRSCLKHHVGKPSILRVDVVDPLPVADDLDGSLDAGEGEGGGGGGAGRGGGESRQARPWQWGPQRQPWRHRLVAGTGRWWGRAPRAGLPGRAGPVGADSSAS